MDVGHLGRAVGWDWDFRQLDSGKLTARATAIGNHNGPGQGQIGALG